MHKDMESPYWEILNMSKGNGNAHDIRNSYYKIEHWVGLVVSVNESCLSSSALHL